MRVDPEQVGSRDFYQWMIHAIIPRPVAWVSTISVGGVTNVAPFSFFAGVSSRPPILMFCPANDRRGRPKDTLRNIEATGEFVVNLAGWDLLEVMNATAAGLPAEESEFTRFDIASTPSVVVKPPRVAAAPIAFECRLEREVRFGEGPGGGNTVFGRIVSLYVSDEVVGPDGLPDPRRLDPVSRLGGDCYARLGELRMAPRPG